ncbi:unnamed protein product [Cladocopium goreaui]|uniref:protein-serine/threonine phosphatase n=1 Tax=Cladocopium goreaui TaxID=2562237 RepID=A0A9P1FMG5_9DINO|nr:unnamed protein product [Cladocopium goreaui]
MEPATASASAWLTVLGLSGEAVVGAEQRPLVQIPMEPSHSVKQIKGWIGSKDPELFALMYDGRKLRDKETCSSLGWKDEVTLYLVVQCCDFADQIAPRRRIVSKEEYTRRTTPRKWLNFIVYAPRPYLFLGNYVNRGIQGSDVLVTLMAYKCQFPEKLYMLRGRHDCRQIARMSEFYEEVCRLYSRKLWRSFIDVLNHLPLCARVNGRVFCVSGGISPELRHLEQINELHRPLEVPEEGLLTDLLWSDPTDCQGWGPSDRGLSYTFGQDVFEEFCETNHIELMVRGMQLSQHGYEYFFQQRLVNVFTCANYMGEWDNRAAVMLLDEDLQHKFWVLP